MDELRLEDIKPGMFLKQIEFLSCFNDPLVKVIKVLNGRIYHINKIVNEDNPPSVLETNLPLVVNGKVCFERTDETFEQWIIITTECDFKPQIVGDSDGFAYLKIHHKDDLIGEMGINTIQICLNKMRDYKAKIVDGNFTIRKKVS